MDAADAFDFRAMPGQERDPEPGSGYLLPGGCISAPRRGEYLRTLWDAALWMGAAPLGIRLLARLRSRGLLRAGLRGWARGVRKALDIRLEMEGLDCLEPGERYVVVPRTRGSRTRWRGRGRKRSRRMRPRAGKRAFRVEPGAAACMPARAAA